MMGNSAIPSSEWLYSRLVVIAAIAAMAALVLNIRWTILAITNLPDRFGEFERVADIRYGSAQRQRLDVYRPTGDAQKRPVVVFWYGGAWVYGAKEEFRFVAAALAEAGYVAILPDYRLYPEARFPTFIEDGALAVRWAHRHAQEFGGDPRSLFVMGHSAGALIAASVAINPKYLAEVGGDRRWIRGLIGLSGPYALQPPYQIKAIFPEPYSPVDWQLPQFVDANVPPVLLIDGDDDRYVDASHSTALAGALRKLGVPTVTHRLHGYTHTDVVTDLAFPWRLRTPIVAHVSEFITEHSQSNRSEAASAHELQAVKAAF